MANPDSHWLHDLIPIRNLLATMHQYVEKLYIFKAIFLTIRTVSNLEGLLCLLNLFVAP